MRESAHHSAVDIRYSMGK